MYSVEYYVQDLLFLTIGYIMNRPLDKIFLTGKNNKKHESIPLHVHHKQQFVFCSKNIFGKRNRIYE